MNHDPIQHKRNNWLGPIFFSPLVTQKKYFFCFIWVLKVSEVHTDSKGRFVSYKVTPSNESSLLVPLQCIAPESSLLGVLFWRIVQNKNERSENKIILGDLNCTMDKIDRDGENKKQILYRYCYNYTLSKLIVDNGLEDLWRRENPDSPEFTCYNRSFSKDPG